MFLGLELALASTGLRCNLQDTKNPALCAYLCYSPGNTRPQHRVLLKRPKSGMRSPFPKPPSDPSLHAPPFTEADISRIIEMAWEDRTAFEAIEVQFGVNESAVIALMRQHMKPSSFRMWRKRMAGRVTKHAALRGVAFMRHRAPHTRQ